MKAQTDKLIAQIYSRINSPVDATLWAAMFSFDVMGDAGFGMDLGSLSSGQEHPASKQIHGFVWVLGVVQSIPWLPNLLSSLPGVNRGFAAFFDLCALVLADKEKVVVRADLILAHLLTFPSPSISTKSHEISCHGCSRLHMGKISPRPLLRNH